MHCLLRYIPSFTLLWTLTNVFLIWDLLIFSSNVWTATVRNVFVLFPFRIQYINWNRLSKVMWWWAWNSRWCISLFLIMKCPRCGPMLLIHLWRPWAAGFKILSHAVHFWIHGSRKGNRNPFGYQDSSFHKVNLPLFDSFLISFFSIISFSISLEKTKQEILKCLESTVETIIWSFSLNDCRRMTCETF